MTGVWCVAARVRCAACACHGTAAPARREPAVEAAVVAHVAQHRDRKPRAVDDLELPDRIVGAHAEALPHLLHADARLRRKVGTAANLQLEGRHQRTTIHTPERGVGAPPAHTILTRGAFVGSAALLPSRPSFYTERAKARGVRRPCHAWRTTAANGLRFLWT